MMSDICTATSPSVYVLTKLQRAQYAAERKKKALNEATRVSQLDLLCGGLGGTYCIVFG